MFLKRLLNYKEKKAVIVLAEVTGEGDTGLLLCPRVVRTVFETWNLLGYCSRNCE